MEKKIAFKELVPELFLSTIKEAFDAKIANLGLFSKKEKAALNELWAKFDTNQELTLDEAKKIHGLVYELSQKGSVLDDASTIHRYLMVTIIDHYEKADS